MTILSKLRRKLIHEGWRSLARAAWRRRQGNGVRLIDPIAEYSFLLNDESPAPSTREVPLNSITWVIPPFHAGAGGHTTIFRFVRMLEAQGFRCNVIVDDGHHFGSSDHFRSLVDTHFFKLDASFFTSMNDAPPAEFTIATGWHTAYKVRRFPDTRHRLYFVQDFEPWFFPVGSKHQAALQSYKLGLVGITAGTWLSTKLRAEFGMEAHDVGFSYDRAVYQPGHRRRDCPKTVFFYARPSTERRAFELGVLALYQLVQQHPEVRVIMAGGDLGAYHLPFSHVSEGVVSVQRLAEIYRECDAALVISLTNLSLLPLELMGSGVPVISNRGPWAEWLLNDDNAILADATPNALCAALHGCLSQPQQAEALAERALRFARSTSWDHEGHRFASILRDLQVRAVPSTLCAEDR